MDGAGGVACHYRYAWGFDPGAAEDIDEAHNVAIHTFVVFPTNTVEEKN